MTEPVVFVSGYWHGSWCWSLVAEELAARGIASVAVDILGHGLLNTSPSTRWSRPFDAGAYAVEPSPVRHLTASAAADDLITRLRRIGRGGPCTLVAHSLNGVVATAVAERHPELVAEIVYVSAFVSLGGRSAYDYLALPEMAGGMVQAAMCNDPQVIGAFRYDTGDPALRTTLWKTLYHDLDPADAEGAMSLLQPDGPTGIATEVISTTERFGSVPRSYVMCLHDHAVPLAMQQRTVADLDAATASPTRVVRLDSSHSPFLSRPAELAQIIADAGQARSADDSPTRSPTGPPATSTNA